MRPMADLIRKIFILLHISFISKSYTRLDKKIVGGDYVKIRHHPHAVFLEIVNKVGETHICGSSVLNQLYLLSAAHCFYGDNNYQISAFAGHENIKKAMVHRRVRTSIVHDNFMYEKVENDIALLLLYRELPLGMYIKRITLKQSFPSGAATGVVAGWGIINDITGQEPISLKSVRQSVKSKRLCAVVGITKSTFCAGSMRTSDPRPAAGDSGSGLVTPSFQLLGIVSYKLELHSALPVYTNVSYFYHWIKQQTQFAYCQYKFYRHNKKNKN